MVTLDDAKSVSREIVSSLHPLSVFVFGSVARQGIGADLDILIVIDRGDKETAAAVSGQVQQRLKPFYRRFPIDPFVVDASTLESHYRNGSPFLSAIVNEGRSLYMAGISDEWTKQAKEELATARYLSDGGYFRGACYHAQQALEKSIKSSLLRAGWQLEKTHSIQRLRALAEDFRVEIPLTDEQTAFIDGIYRGRYPAEAGLLPFGEPAKEDAERALEIATSIVNR